MTDRPTISITISTVQGWPSIRENVATAEIAAEAVGGEVIVTDGSGGPIPDRADLSPHTVWHAEPGKSVFQLRGAGYALAQAPIIAITEDHCRVPPDWARRMLDAHEAHPEAAAIGGSVENGAIDHMLDWASFFVVQATIAAPIRSGPASKLAGAVNVSYKRSAVGQVDDFDGLGMLDVIHQRQLQQSGQILFADDSIRVVHDQSLGFRGTTAIHYHAGRTFAGFLRQRMDRAAWLRLLGVPVVPYVRFGRALWLMRTKGHGAQVRTVWPAILWLYVVQGVGQVVGFAAGPGDSPGKLQ